MRTVSKWRTLCTKILGKWAKNTQTFNAKENDYYTKHVVRKNLKTNDSVIEFHINVIHEIVPAQITGKNDISSGIIGSWISFAFDVC